MNVAEQVLQFDCAGEPLLGIVSQPCVASELGVVIIVGGPQYRVGSHRQFVELARHLAHSGHFVLRFDYRGMGDSGGDQRSFESVDDDIRAAIDAFASVAGGPRQVVLWGLCDGASAALLYAARQADARVVGMCLLNPWVRSDQSLARTHVRHYYLQRLGQRAFWAKLARGGVAWAALAGLLRNVRSARRKTDPEEQSADFRKHMAAAWRTFDGPILLLLSELDLTAREFTEHTAADVFWQQAMAARPARVLTIPAADHTCSTAGSKQIVESAVEAWLVDVAESHRA